MKKSLARLDLNLLFTLQLLVEERSVSKAAKKLNVTPSTVSKSLNKLRDWFDDALFVKTPSGLAPTPFTQSLEQELADWLQMSTLLLGKREDSQLKGVCFDIIAESPLLLGLLGPLMQEIHLRYPESKVRTSNWDYDSVDALIQGRADIALTGRETHPRSKESLDLLPYYIDFEVLLEQSPVVFLRKDHPALSEEWTMETFLKYAHINIVWEKSDSWALDDVLADLGEERTIGLTMSSFEQALFMAEQPGHDMLTTAPEHCLLYTQRLHPDLVTLPIPVEENQRKELMIPYTLLWHKRNGHNPKIVWLREALKSIFLGSHK